MTRKYWIIALAYVALIATVACSQASPKPAETSKPNEAAPKEQSAPTSKPAEPSFMDIMNLGKQAAYKVTYQISGTANGQKMSGEQTWYAKPPKTRMDFSAGGADKSIRV